MGDLQMTVYSKDSSAAAVKLCDYGEAYIIANPVSATLNFERHVRIKILNKSGLEWADVEIPLYYEGSREEKVREIRAASYNLEGGKVVETHLEKTGIFKEKLDRRFRLQKFTIPNVREGSVIEYTYTIISEFATNFPNWSFQSAIPTRHSEYWAKIPDFIFYQRYMQGYVPVTNFEVVTKNQADFSVNAHHWVIKDVPAFKEEPYITSKDEYITKVNFALSHIQFPGESVKEIMGSWTKLSSDLLESEAFGVAIERSKFLNSLVEVIVNGEVDSLKKVEMLHKWVRDNIEWTGHCDYYAADLREIVENKKGSSGDINLLLASMLEKAGFKVEMVLLSTRDHGAIRQGFPMREQFNYTLCGVYVGDRFIMLDATEKVLPYTTIPDRCINSRGLVISKDNHRWMNMETKVKAKTVINADLKIGDEGEFRGTVKFSRDGYDAMAMRKKYFAVGKEKYMSTLQKDFPWEFEESEFEDVDKLEKPAKEKHSIVVRNSNVATGEIIYVNPFISSQIMKNPFTAETREYPVDFGKNVEELYMVKIEIPEGYVLDEMPKSRVIQLPENKARYLYNITKSGNAIHLTSSLSINRPSFDQNEYVLLKEFYSVVVAKQAEQLVLKKATE